MNFTRISILLLLFSSFLFSCHTEQTKKDDRPNIILIMADDIGFSDIGCFGSEIQTPNLDRMAEKGMRFSQFYNMAKCNPTRSSLMTGLFYGDERALSFPQLIRESGYTTILSGKEHFDPWVPERCWAVNNFDQSLTFWATTEYFIPPSGKFVRPFFLNGKQLKPEEIEHEIEPFYKTDAFTDYALRWMDEALQKDKPFFLYLPYHSAHYPLQARQEDIAKYRGKYKIGWDKLREQRYNRMIEMGVLPAQTKLSDPSANINRFRGHPKGNEKIRSKIPLYRPWNSLDEKEQDELDLEMAVYAAMVDRLDQNIGRVLAKIKEAGIENNTLIMFLSDNGSCPYDSNKNFDVPPAPANSHRTLCAAWANAGNTPFRYFKQYGHEGGPRTHFMAYWPKVIKANIITDQQAHLVDLFPTFLELAGISYPEEIEGEPTIPLHGNSLLPIFKGEQRPEPEFLISGFSERFRMFRQGDWKLVRANGDVWELYNMKDDPAETNNLATDNPVKLQEMIHSYKASKQKIDNTLKPEKERKKFKYPYL